jgi:hypothetical protein
MFPTINRRVECSDESAQADIPNVHRWGLVPPRQPIVRPFLARCCECGSALAVPVYGAERSGILRLYVRIGRRGSFRATSRFVHATCVHTLLADTPIGRAGWLRRLFAQESQQKEERP